MATMTHQVTTTTCKDEFVMTCTCGVSFTGSDTDCQRNKEFHETEVRQAKVARLAELVLEQTQARLKAAYPTSPQWEWEKVEVRPATVWTKVDRGPEGNMSGMLMVENATGRIYGIKGYGRVHKGHYYGTLDEVDQWYWGNYGPMKREVQA